MKNKYLLFNKSFLKAFLNFSMVMGFFYFGPLKLYSADYKHGRTPPPNCKSTSSSNGKVKSNSYPTENEFKNKCKGPPPAPSCSYGVCKKEKCVMSPGWCVDHYTEMPKDLGFNLNPSQFAGVYPGISNVMFIQLDSIGRDRVSGKPLKEIARYSDPDSTSCVKSDGSGKFEVQGGETVCDLGNIYQIHHSELTDSVLTFITNQDANLYAKCSYFNPKCDTCCIQWEPAECCPPPPPPPPGP